MKLDPQRELVTFYMNNPNKNNEIIFKDKEKKFSRFTTNNRTKLIIILSLIVFLSFIFALLIAFHLKINF